MKNIFDKVALKNLRVKNRLVRSATWEGIAEIDGSIGDDTYEIYRELARAASARLLPALPAFRRTIFISAA